MLILILLLKIYIDIILNIQIIDLNYKVFIRENFMQINMENSKSLLFFLIPTIIITIILFSILGAGILLITGFIVLMIAACIVYYLGLYLSEKNNSIPFVILVIFIIVSIIVSIIIFILEPFEEIIDAIITIVGLIILFVAYCFSWYSGLKKNL